MASKPEIREGSERDPPSFELVVPSFARSRRALRAMFLLPLTLATLVMAGATIFLEYRQIQAHRQYMASKTVEGLMRFYREELAGKAQMLGVAAEMLRQDEGLQDALARRDREGLLQRASPVFQSLRQQYSITHMYFVAPDRTAIARMHLPDRHGDLISRLTLLQAEASGRAAWGIELGPMGTLVLRFVLPVESGGQRIGYVETGLEIDAILQSLTRSAGDRLFLLLSKQYLNRQDWERGMTMLGREPQWDRFNGYVLSSASAGELAPDVEQLMRIGKDLGTGSVPSVLADENSRRTVFVALNDAAGTGVGSLVAVLDTAEYEDVTHRQFLGTTLAVLLVGLALVILFLALLGRIGRQLEQHEMLRDLAIRDGLTELLNRRAFVSLLDSELADTRRNGRSLSLLMIDIDHFKEINDQHGHPTGDRVLKSLCERVLQQVRTADWVCRYGGEEISVILPDTDEATALQVAERIRSAIGTDPFAIEPGIRFPLTVSVGVAAVNPDRNDPAGLVEAADSALYDAKQAGRNRVCMAI